MVSTSTALVDALRADVGDALQAAGTYTEHGYTLFYLREDVDERYSTDDIDTIHRDLALEGISKTHLESLFKSGPHACTVHAFEEATTFHFPADDYSGLFIGVDADASVDLRAFLGRYERGLDLIE